MATQSHLGALSVCNLTFFTFGLLAAFPALTFAQQPLTLQDCLRLAGAAPSAVTVARQERDIAARDATQARAGFLPQSRVDSGLIYNSPLRSDRSVQSFIPLNAIREYLFLFSATQEFDTSGRLRAEYARARAGQELATASLGLAQRNLKRAVTAAYYRALLSRRVVRIAQDALAGSESFEKRTKALFEGGESAQADVVKASAQVAFLQQALNTADLEARLANQDLASFWTRDVAQTVPLVDVLEDAPPAPEAEAAQGAPFLKRLEFGIIDAQRKGFEADARGARSALLPQLSAMFQYGLDAPAVQIRDRGYAAFLNLTIPVFDWMKARSAVEQARLRARQVETNRAISERTFSREYQSALARVKQLFERISLTRRQVELAGDDLRLSRIRYEGGEGSALDVVTAQNQLAQARTNYDTAMADYLNAKADLEVASGR